MSQLFSESVLHWYQLGFGILAIGFSLQRGILRTRDGTPWPNQRFARICLFVLGLAMVGFSIWGIYLGKR